MQRILGDGTYRCREWRSLARVQFGQRAAGANCGENPVFLNSPVRGTTTETNESIPDLNVKPNIDLPTASGVDRWQAWAVLAVSVAVMFAVFRDTALGFIPIWNTDSFGHGYLIIPISAFLMWQCRHRIAAAPIRPSLSGLGILLALSLVWALGTVAELNVVVQFALVAMFQALFLTIFGWSVFRAAVFPLCYLYFAVPFGEFLIPYLQDITAAFAVGALQVLAVPVYSDGIYIQTPSGSYLVAEACSGSRYLLSTLAISVLAAGLLFRSWHKRVLFIVAGIAVSILANVLRAAGVILLAHWIDPSLAGPVHITYGLVFVAIVTLVYLMVGASFKERSIQEYALAETPATFAADRSPAAPVWSVVAVGAAALISVSAVSAYVGHVLAPSGDASATAIGAPAVNPPWQVTDREAFVWQPSFPGASAVLMRSFRNDSTTAEMFIGLYTEQRRGSEMINYRNSFEGESWGRAGSGGVSVDYAGERIDAVYIRMLPQRHLGNETEMTGRMVWYWYWVGDRYTASPLAAKFYEVMAILLGRSRSAAVIAIAADYRDQPAEAVAKLQDFIRHLQPLRPILAQTTARAE